MTIERIEVINNYRIFKAYTWPEDLPNFARYNLFYGWNGAGKTTLSSLFHLLQEQSSVTDSDIRFQIDGTDLSGKDIHTAALPNVRVFNRDTVHQTLFEQLHQELPPVYYLGKESAEKQREVVKLKEALEVSEGLSQENDEALIKEKQALDRLCTDQAAVIKNLLTSSGGGPYNNFNRANFKQQADELATSDPLPDRLSENDREHLMVTKNGKPMENLSRVSIPSIDYNGLTRKVETQLKRSVTASVLDELLQDPKVAHWVQTGVELHTGDNNSSECRFCKQKLTEGRLSELEAHFNDALGAFQQEIDAQVSKIANVKLAIEQYQMPDSRRFYSHLKKEYEDTVKGWPTSQQAIGNFLDALISALNKKRDEPFKQLNLNDFMFALGQAGKDSHWLIMVLGLVLDVSQNLIAVFGLNTVDKINRLIDRHNKHTQTYSEQVRSASSQLAQDIVLGAIEDFNTLNSDIETLKETKASLREEIESNRQKITTLELEIRQHQKAADELNAEMEAYLGRDELRFETSENGYRITRNGHAALHLSEGERTAISFMYFLKTLEDEGFDLENGIVVIDDPISSLDSNSLYSAFGFMKEKTKNAKQLFVLTHSFSFFRLVRGWFFKQPGMGSRNVDRHVSRFYLLDGCYQEGVRSAQISPIDPLLKDYESEYHFLFKKVYEEAQNSIGEKPLESYYGLPNVGRRLLESFLTFKLPNLEAGKLEKKLDEVEFDPAKKTRIIRFLHMHSHYDQVGAPEHDLSVLNETPAILSDLMDLIRAFDPEHYEGMEQLILPPIEEAANVTTA